MNVRLEVAGPVATLVLDRPEKLNALTRQMLVTLEEHLVALRADQSIRCLVVRAEGRAFCAGDDIGGAAARAPEVTLDVADKWRTSHLRVALELLQLPIPVVAALQGHVLGAGLDLALSCDFRIGTEDVLMGTPVVKRGLAGAGLYLLTRYLGIGRATEIVMLGESLDAVTALDLGLVNRVVPADELSTQTSAWADRLASGPTGSYAAIKRARNRVLAPGLLDGFHAQLGTSLDLQFLRDPVEGRTAWRERRPPSFPGGYRSIGEM